MLPPVPPELLWLGYSPTILFQRVPPSPRGMKKMMITTIIKMTAEIQKTIMGLTGFLVGSGFSGVGTGLGVVVFSEVGCSGTGCSDVEDGVDVGSIIGSDSRVGSGVGVGVGSGVGVEIGSGLVGGVGSGFDCGVILFGDPCPLGVKLSLSIVVLYYSFYG